MFDNMTIPQLLHAPNESRMEDPAIPNRTVADKPANRPFLAYKAFRKEQERVHNEWVKNKEEHDAQVARGEKVEPLSRDPTEPEEVGLLGLLKFILCLIIFVALAGKFITGSYTWEYQSRWMQLKTYFPEANQRLFSEGYLSTFDGKVDGQPVYLAIDGVVYDVSKGSAYKLGGSYHILAGVDAARAFATGCFKEHRTHDIRGLSEKELASLEHWKLFYAEHKDYIKVGKVSHQSIDPASPIPVHCDPKKAEERRRAGEKPPKAESHLQKGTTKHEEL